MELVEILDINNTALAITTTTITELYTKTITGGSLGTDNKVRWQMQGKFSFSASNTLSLYMVYGGTTVTSCYIESNTAAERIDKGLTLEGWLNSSGSASAQYGFLTASAGLAVSENIGQLVGFGNSVENSGGDLDFKILAQLGIAVGGTDSVTHLNSTLELLSFTQDTTIPDLDEPTAYIYTNSRLNRLHYSKRKDVIFYAPLKHEFTFFGIGTYSFVRASSIGATWRDGASHTVSENYGRFEYNGEVPLGLYLDTSIETLGFDPQNPLNDSNTLCWVQDGVYKSTKRGDTNFFNASSIATGITAHIAEVVKFNKVISTSEDNEMAVILV